MAIEGVVLAAGLSQRADCFKMTLKLGEKTLVEHCISNLSPHCNRIIVVGGYQFVRLYNILKSNKKILLVYNPRYLDGMLSSVKAGFKYIQSERFFYIPGDYPFITEEVFTTMLAQQSKIVVPSYNGKKGHPVLFKTAAIQKLLFDKKCASLKEFIVNEGYSTVQVNDVGILHDLDTPSDYNKLLTIFEKRRGLQRNE